MMDNTPRELANDRKAAQLDILWDDGTSQRLSHALLRSSCKCTVCQSQRLLTGAVAIAQADVRVEQVNQVGHYAVQLVFSDGHARGIYPWSYLRTLASLLAEGHSPNSLR